MTAPLPLSEVDELRIELDATKAELNVAQAEMKQLAVIAEAATYLVGPEECVADRDCEEYYLDETGGDSGIDHCSHITVAYATHADMYGREGLERIVTQLLEDLRRANVESSAEVLEALAGGVYNIAVYAADEIGVAAADELYKREPYKTVLALESADLAAERRERATEIAWTNPTTTVGDES